MLHLAHGPRHEFDTCLEFLRRRSRQLVNSGLSLQMCPGHRFDTCLRCGRHLLKQPYLSYLALDTSLTVFPENSFALIPIVVITVWRLLVWSSVCEHWQIYNAHWNPDVSIALITRHNEICDQRPGVIPVGLSMCDREQQATQATADIHRRNCPTGWQTSTNRKQKWYPPKKKQKMSDVVFDTFLTPFFLFAKNRPKDTCLTLLRKSLNQDL